jgi:hypothetical protein
MVRSLLYAVLFASLCPLLAAQQLPAAGATAGALQGSAPAQELPDNPQLTKPGDSGWNRVRDLARGDEIYIQTAGGIHQVCRFGGATGDYVFCDPLFDSSGEGRYRIDRAEVEKIRLEPRRWSLKESAGVGAAIGFVLPLVTHRATDPMPRVIEAPICAGIGALAGLVLSPVISSVSQLIPGRLVYRQPRQERKPRASAGHVPSQINPNAAATEVQESSQTR